MGKSQATTERTLPRWMVIAGSVLISAHLLVVVLMALAARSGPWIPPLPMLPTTPSEGPKFATIITNYTAPGYLQPLGLSHTYRFDSNRVTEPGVYFEVRLRDDKGREMRTLKLPQDDANSWVKHRQQMLARGLGDDYPVPFEELQTPEVVGAEKQEVQKLDYWLTADEIRRLLTRKVVHDTFVVVDEPPPKDDDKEAQLRREKELNLTRIKVFYPLRANPDRVAQLLDRGLLSQPYFVQEDSLIAVRSDIPIVAGVSFYRVREDKIDELQQLVDLGTPFVLSGEDTANKQHLYRLAVREDQKGQVGAIVGMMRPLSRPSPTSLMLAHSYLRHLARQHGAESAELIRYSRQPVLPSYMYFQREDQLPMGAFMEIVCYFGDLKRDFEEGAR